MLVRACVAYYSWRRLEPSMNAPILGQVSSRETPERRETGKDCLSLAKRMEGDAYQNETRIFG